MAEAQIQAEVREILGKKVRFLRRQGLTPANLYGPDTSPTPLQMDSKALHRLTGEVSYSDLIDLTVEGDKGVRTVMIREIQRHPVTGHILHVDLYQPRLTEEIAVEVPLQLVGEAPAVENLGGTLFQNLTSLHIKALPRNLPHIIEVDISELKEINDVLRADDVQVADGVTILNDPDDVVARVALERVAVAEEAVEAVAEEAVAEKVTEEAAEAKAAEEEETS